MRIFIGDQTKEYMQILGINEFPFAENEIKTKFRILIKMSHPDSGGKKQDAQKLIQAYRWLLPLSKTPESILPPKEKRMFDLYKKCEKCNGEGKIHRSTVVESCHICFLGIKKIIRCRECDEAGRFTLKSGRRVICKSCGGTKKIKIKCRECEGTGLRVIPAKDYECLHCNGRGEIEIRPFNPVVEKGAVL